MRFIIAAVILTLALPAAYAADSPKGVCKTRCDSMARFCFGHANTKQARNSCKANRKICKKQCK